MWPSSDQDFSRPFTRVSSAESASGIDASLLLRMMDEIDHGMPVIDAHCQLRHANHLARHALATSRFIACHGQMLMGSKTAYTQQIDQALKHALKGHRQMISLKDAEAELTLAFVALCHALESDAPPVLVLFSRQNACENLAVRMYARAHQLSPSEESVLIALCKGYTIPEIAEVTLPSKNVSLAEWFNPSKESGNDEHYQEGALHARIQARGRAAGRRRPARWGRGQHARWGWWTRRCSTGSRRIELASSPALIARRVSAEQMEISGLRAELARVKMERDILGKATAYFAKAAK